MPSSDEGNVRRSSHSGRLLLRPLAFWANERLIVPHRRGTSAQLVIDNQSFDIFTDAAQVIVIVFLFHGLLSRSRVYHHVWGEITLTNYCH